MPGIKQSHLHYIGLTEHTFKDELCKYNNSFKYVSKRNSAVLSNFIWGIKKDKINVDLDWSNLDKPNLILQLYRMHVTSHREISHHFLYKESVE